MNEYNKNQAKGYLLITAIMLSIASIIFCIFSWSYIRYLKENQIKIIHDVNTFRVEIDKKFNI